MLPAAEVITVRATARTGRIRSAMTVQRSSLGFKAARPAAYVSALFHCEQGFDPQAIDRLR